MICLFVSPSASKGINRRCRLGNDRRLRSNCERPVDAEFKLGLSRLSLPSLSDPRRVVDSLSDVVEIAFAATVESEDPACPCQ